MADILKNYKVSFRIENFVVTDVGSQKDVVKSIRFYIRATDVFTFHHEVFHVINFDVDQMNFDNFIPFDQVTKEIADEWIQKSLSVDNFNRIKQQLYEMFFPKERYIVPSWVVQEIHRITEKLDQK